MKRVLIADDHELFRDGIASLLRARGYEVIGEAANGLEVVEKARQLTPDLILMDIRMPELGGLEATRLLQAEMPDIKVVILTVSDSEEDLFEAIKCGARGYLLKNLKSEVFFDFISSVAQGDIPLSPKMAAKILAEFSRLTESRREDKNLLTDREGDVLRLVASGKTNKEIAADLFVSESTVKYHLRNILDRLHLENRSQIIAYAARKGLQPKE